MDIALFENFLKRNQRWHTNTHILEHHFPLCLKTCVCSALKPGCTFLREWPLTVLLTVTQAQLLISTLAGYLFKRKERMPSSWQRCPLAMVIPQEYSWFLSLPSNFYYEAGHNDKNENNNDNSHLWSTFSVPGPGLNTFYTLSYLIFTALYGRHYDFFRFTEIAIMTLSTFLYR